MTKFIVVSMALIAASIAVSSAITPDEKAAIKANALPAIKKCEEEFSITKEDILAAKKNKNIEDLNPCFYACFFKKIGIINDAGLYDTDAAKKLHTKYVSDAEDLNKLSQISQTCSAVNDQTVSDGANGCERAKLLLSCYIKENSAFSLFSE